MRNNYEFPARAETMLKNYRIHVSELLQSIDHFNASKRFDLIACFPLLDDLLIYLYQLENGGSSERYTSEGLPPRPQEHGTYKGP